MNETSTREREQSTLGTMPYEQEVDEDRTFDVECSCGETARLYCYAGRDWPWKHDMVTGLGHVVEYRRVDTEVSDD
ncbi:hypothetical protein KY092_11445 [Natronomonas gomsonensis]|uniref:hypothetical protein n=1 Tax=Natronomonas gomsonensis TaxID=1046043 RepID=UPI0020CA3E01|nr:hypothetical protein [Natronomonas gomsonensis]MCY4731169.1 hypothetical protein [Natronomonas gomsonensis]